MTERVKIYSMSKAIYTIQGEFAIGVSKVRWGQQDSLQPVVLLIAYDLHEEKSARFLQIDLLSGDAQQWSWASPYEQWWQAILLEKEQLIAWALGFSYDEVGFGHFTLLENGQVHFQELYRTETKHMM